MDIIRSCNFLGRGREKKADRCKVKVAGSPPGYGCNNAINIAVMYFLTDCL